MRCAVIDLGTNTFHLLIVEKSPSGAWKPLVRHRIYVKLAEEGLRRIGDRAFARGLDAIKTYKTQLDAAGILPKNIRALGTAAIRSSSNGAEFLQKIQEVTGIKAEAITGEQEAMLIYKGVRRAVPFPAGNLLIMDIGGGSVEFILCNRDRVHWWGSFDIGVSVLFQNFHKNDPITPEEIIAIEDFLEISLKSLFKAIQKHPTRTLIGAAGAFDVIDNFLLDPKTKPPLYGYTKTPDFLALAKYLIGTSLAERQQMHQLTPERIEMIVVALVLTKFVVEKLDIQEMYSSTYALKEGMLETYF